MVRSLVSFKHIGRSFFKSEVRPTVLEREAAFCTRTNCHSRNPVRLTPVCTFWNQACPKAHVVGVDKTTGIAMFIHHAEIYCAGGRDGASSFNVHSGYLAVEILLEP